MTEPAKPQSEQSSELGSSSHSGGVNITDADVVAHGDIVGRDKITVIINPPQPTPVAPLASQRQYFEPEMRLIAAGPFLMGSQPGPNADLAETPQHEVTLPVYSIGKYPITNREYAEFIKREKAQDAPKGWPGRRPPADKLDHPVVNVSWTDAVAYCKWLSQQTGRTYRLPTEAEWEKAARGTNGRVYPWGDSWVDHACNAGGDGTTPVTAHLDGASPFDCQDMLGNVEEWTSTLWGTDEGTDHAVIYAYPYHVDDGREDTHQILFRPLRVHRGGSYLDSPDNLRCSARRNSSPIITVKWRGFRVVLEK